MAKYKLTPEQLVQYNKMQEAKSKVDPAYEAERLRIAGTNPNKTVTKEQFNELRGLYKKAEASGKGPAVEAYQKKFHEYLPEAALQVIARNPKRTRLAQEKGYTGFDLRGNEDASFGDRTRAYDQEMQKLEAAIPRSPDGPPIDPYKAEVKGVKSNPDTSYQVPNQPNEIADPNYWLQDVVKTAGAASDYFNIKKRLPWAPKVSPVIPDPTFVDPTRELASNTEQMNIGTQGAGVFGSPQSYAATYSGIQGQGAKNAADILSRYNNQNVEIADKFSAMKADIMNKSNQANANIATDLYDKTVAANDNFDKSKNMARQELRQSYIDAVTNRANAQVMNTIYPNYKINPTTGGMLDFYKGDKLTGQMPQSQLDTQIKAYQDLIAKGIDPDNAMKFLGYDSRKGQQFDQENLDKGYHKPY